MFRTPSKLLQRDKKREQGIREPKEEQDDKDSIEMADENNWNKNLKVPILTTENFARWKYDIMIILSNRGVWRIVSKEQKAPANIPDDATAAQVAAYNKSVGEWLTTDGKAKEILTRSLDERHHDMIRSCKYAFQIWEVIAALYEQKTGTSVLLAQKEFHDSKWTSDDTALGFFGRLRTVANKLEALGTKMDDSLILSKIISEAPPQYTALKESWEVSLLSGADLKLQDLLGQMVRVEKQYALEVKKVPGGNGGEAFLIEAILRTMLQLRDERSRKGPVLRTGRRCVRSELQEEAVYETERLLGNERRKQEQVTNGERRDR